MAKLQYKHIISFISLFALNILLLSFIPNKQMRHKNNRNKVKELTVLSYNVENLFDTIDNPLTDDDEFLPNSARHWTKARYFKKLHHIANVLSRAGGQLDFPALVGLVEVENNEVLEDLIHKTGLNQAQYKYVISHGPDRRGIDVALLYQDSIFKILSKREIEIRFPSNLGKKSRNILHVSGLILDKEPLHIFVCHAPSRREGAKESQKYRNTVMQSLRAAAELIYQDNPKAHIIIMGDFNAPPEEINYSKALDSKMLSRRYNNKHLKDKHLILFNIMSQIPEHNTPGSYCYKGRWDQLDQFILSQSLLREDSPLQYKDESVRNYAPRYLQKNNSVASGFNTPWRTYAGPYYIGGYSDHFPILMKLIYKV